MDIYSDIAARTGGDIYIGVVGPVRTGKSTFITEFMQKLVIPSIADPNIQQRCIDELPQSADGKTIMTTQPRFIPSEAAPVNFENAKAKVRLIDCVGYLVEGAMGHTENDRERMVKTPWSKTEMPFSKAAELGTNKVVTEHSTIAVVVTADGSFTDIPRNNYTAPEERVVAELSATGKPYVIVLNTRTPEAETTLALADAMRNKYEAEVIVCDVLNMTTEDINTIMLAMLNEFPVRKMEVEMPRWMRKLPKDHWLISGILAHVKESCNDVCRMKDCYKLFSGYDADGNILETTDAEKDMANGVVRYTITPEQGLYYKILSDMAGTDISDEFALMSYVTEVSGLKNKFERVEDAMKEAELRGYGIVQPPMNEMEFYPPEIVHRGNRYGVTMKAAASTYHIMKVDVTTSVSPLNGTEEQSKYMLGSFEDNPQQLWETNMFGKTLATLARDGLADKINSMPLELQNKLRRTAGRIVNENKANMICFLI